MSSIYTNVLSNEEIDYLNNLPEVLAAKTSLDNRVSGMVYFTVPITDVIRETLQTKFGLHITGLSIPMRWIKGDTAPHIDVSSSNQVFENTYLLYLNDSPGELVIDSHRYPIQANTGFVFNEGLSHETQDTGSVPRLLIGPMNEFAQPVGAPVFYYATQADALADTNSIGSSGGYTVISVGIYTSWKIAYKSTGSFPPNTVYHQGDTLDSTGFPGYRLYAFVSPVVCFRAGSMIKCEDGYHAVETLKKGDMVETLDHGLVAVDVVGSSMLPNRVGDNREDRLYVLRKEDFSLTEDLYLTGGHSLLVDKLNVHQVKEILKMSGAIFMTDNKLRLFTCLEEKAVAVEEENVQIYHLCLENTDPELNYGIYANGLLVETCQKSCIEKHMKVIS